MKKFLSLFIILLCCLVELNAQRGLILRPRGSGFNGSSYRYHSNVNTETLTGDFPGAISFTLLLGPSFINGDMDGLLSRSASLDGNFMASLAVNHIFPGNVGYKLTYMFGSYLQSDEGSLKHLDYRRYAINTTLSEIGIQCQYYILGGPYGDDQTHNLYVSGGVGLILNNSIPTVYSNPIEPPSIYRQNSATLNFPITLGYKYDIGNNMLIGFELSDHFAMDDYVDGLKPKVGNYANDVISHFALTFTYNLYRGK